MSCINPPHLDIGDIPGLSLLLGNIVITLPGVGLNLCCNFDLLPPPIIIPLGAIIEALVVTPADCTAIDDLLNTLHVIVEAINTLLDELSFDCPLS